MLLHSLDGVMSLMKQIHMFHMLSLLPYYLPVISLMTDFICFYEHFIVLNGCIANMGNT